MHALTRALVVGLLAAVVVVGLTGVDAADTEGMDPVAYLPVVVQSGSADSSPCSNPSGGPYNAGTAFQFDLDNPVRSASTHADKNIEVRGYVANDDDDLQRELVNYGSDDPTQPPQLATLFNPARVNLEEFYQVYRWNWSPSPDPGEPGAPKVNPPVTALGLETTPGEAIHVPVSGYDIGGGMEVLVLYADADTVALRYTREDSSGSPGYTVHVDNICTHPSLLALYQSLDDPNGPRYVYVPPGERPYGYPLPTLAAGQVIGTARSDELVVAVVDTGAFMDPRSCNEWWQIRPGYGGNCPAPDW